MFPSWSPDGTRIAFSSWRDGNAEVYTMDVDGSGIRRITRNDADDLSPAWSPDGNVITFVSRRDGNMGIYTIKVDGSDERNLRSKGASKYLNVSTRSIVSATQKGKRSEEIGPPQSDC